MAERQAVQTKKRVKKETRKVTLTSLRLSLRQRSEMEAQKTPDSAATPEAPSSGLPLDLATRSFMEQRFGHDFSQVRVHVDTQADRAARALQASAFTRGQEISFAAGNYRPDLPRGRELLAHELAHTLQQRSAQSTEQGHVPAPLLSGRQVSRLEREAETAARQVLSGSKVPEQAISLSVPGTQGMIARQAASTMVRPATAPEETARQPAWESEVEQQPDRVIAALSRRVVESLRRDPDDATGDVHRQLQRLNASSLDRVMGDVRSRTTANEFARIQRVLAAPTPVTQQVASSSQALTEAPPLPPVNAPPEVAQTPAAEAPSAGPAASVEQEIVPLVPETRAEAVQETRVEPAEETVAPESAAVPPQEQPVETAAPLLEATAAEEKQRKPEGAPSAEKKPASDGTLASAPALVQPSGAAVPQEIRTATAASRTSVVDMEAQEARAVQRESVPAAATAESAPAVDETASAGVEAQAAPDVQDEAAPETAEAPVESSAVGEREEMTERAEPEPLAPVVNRPEPAAPAEVPPEAEAATLATEPAQEPATESEPSSSAEQSEPEDAPAPAEQPAPEEMSAPAEQAEPEDVSGVVGNQDVQADNSQEEGAPAEGDAGLTGGSQEGGTPQDNSTLMPAVAETSDDVAPTGGGGGGGSPIQDQPEPDVPDVSQSEPEEALTRVGNLSPAQLQGTLSSVSSAASRSVNTQRAELAEHPPEMERPGSTPENQGPEGEEAPAGTQASETESEQQVERVPTGSEQLQARPAPPPADPQLPTQGINGPRVTNDAQGQESAVDVQQLQTSVQALPTHDSALDVTAGPAPQLSLAGNADPAHMQEQRQQLDNSVTRAHTQARAEAAAPMGEHHIVPRVPHEILRADLTAGAPTPGAQAQSALTPGANAAAGSSPSAPAGLASAQAASAEAQPGAASAGTNDVEAAASIVAQQERGGAIRSAVAQARAAMQRRRQEQQTQAAEARTTAQQDIEQQTQQAQHDQTDERAEAQREVRRQRRDWNQAQTDLVERANADANRAQQQGEQRITDQQGRAEREAGDHIREGNQRIATARREGEQEATRTRRDAQNETSSGGVLSWLSSRARSFFDRVKRSIQQAFERARARVREAIQQAQQLACAVIDRARQAIVGVIQWAGNLMIAAGGVLLVGFPQLRARFSQAIQERVNRAVARVNEFADNLKRDVQRTLNFLGAALNAALGLLERGLLAAVDSVNQVVQGAIRFARSALQALAGFIALIKDIAANPRQWLRNLGAGIMDGIRNHLWRAFKTAIKNWFNEKVEEVLGLGLAIWNLLRSGGISLARIGTMAWEAIKAAIPRVLIQLLIEKLVTMLIPGAGAVLAIIEGLKAAWGAVQRILQAIQRFFIFLRAVKTGQAGRPFAEAVAAAAIAVIDFVANWLLQRLRRPAGAVAGRIRAIAQRIRAAMRRAGQAIRRTVGRVIGGLRSAGRSLASRLGRGLRGAGRALARSRLGQALRRAGRAIARSRFGRAIARGYRAMVSRVQRLRERFRAWRERRRQRRQERKQQRLQRAVSAIRPQLHRLLMGGTSRTYLFFRLLAWQARYLLSSLRMLPDGTIFARVNPSENILKSKRVQIGRALEPILRRAEARFLEQLEDNLDEDSTANLAEAERHIAENTKENLPALSRAEQIILLRRIRAGEISVRRNQVIRFEEDIQLQIRRPRNTALYFQRQGGEYPSIVRSFGRLSAELGIGQARILQIIGNPSREGVERELLSLRMGISDPTARALFDSRLAPQIRQTAFLTQSLETARAPGLMPVTALSNLLGEDAREVMGRSGELATMSSLKATSSIEAERRRRRRLTAAQRRARTRRHERITNVFLRLKERAQSVDIRAEEGGPDSLTLQTLAAAFERWMDAKLAETPDASALEAATNALELELIAFLGRYHGVN